MRLALPSLHTPGVRFSLSAREHVRLAQHPMLCDMRMSVRPEDVSKVNPASLFILVAGTTNEHLLTQLRAPSPQRA